MGSKNIPTNIVRKLWAQCGGLCQFNYQDAIKDDLPIGSGIIESAHGYVIQERLKLYGCWWKLENAMTMLALRVLRAN